MAKEKSNPARTTKKKSGSKKSSDSQSSSKPNSAGGNIDLRMAKAALDLAAQRGWGPLTLDEIATGAKVSAEEAERSFKRKDDVLPAIIALFDAESAKARPDSRGSLHDRLFEVLMTRIDALQAHRKAILDIMAEAKRHPQVIAKLLPAHVRSMRLMLSLAGAKNSPWQEPFAITGLLAVYSLALCSWRKDTSSDLSKTMAGLDRHLHRAGSCAETIFRRLP
ncbi:MAG: TetR/AcrR family transcriptional regulator [Pseudomonadota bacterium]|nr:TetR/AcrR family transcriptional regulator [Pseudomonadota bacterium]